jgi:hypothetical protein
MSLYADGEDGSQGLDPPTPRTSVTGCETAAASGPGRPWRSGRGYLDRVVFPR